MMKQFLFLFIFAISLFAAPRTFAQDKSFSKNSFYGTMEIGAKSSNAKGASYSSFDFLLCPSVSISSRWDIGMYIGARDLLDNKTDMVISRDGTIGYKVEYVRTDGAAGLQQIFTVFSGPKKGRFETEAFLKVFHPKTRMAYIKTGVGYSAPYSGNKGFAYVSGGIGICLAN